LILILASTSPRRYQILTLLKTPFLMVPPETNEKSEAHWLPSEEALGLAQRKAASVANRFPSAVVLGSDTLINLNGLKIGKPENETGARRILRELRGRTHEVLTGVAMLHQASGKSIGWIEAVKVTMRSFSDAELDAYASSGEPLDKAGAYSLQGKGRSLIERLEGDYLAAVGLPLKAVATGLRSLGVPVTVDVDKLYAERDFLNWRTFSPPR
jgi:nucleoside triphosphate pyrophosphatase